MNHPVCVKFSSDDNSTDIRRRRQLLSSPDFELVNGTDSRQFNLGQFVSEEAHFIANDSEGSNHAESNCMPSIERKLQGKQAGKIPRSFSREGTTDLLLKRKISRHVIQDDPRVRVKLFNFTLKSSRQVKASYLEGKVTEENGKGQNYSKQLAHTTFLSQFCLGLQLGCTWQTLSKVSKFHWSLLINFKHRTTELETQFFSYLHVAWCEVSHQLTFFPVSAVRLQLAQMFYEKVKPPHLYCTLLYFLSMKNKDPFNKSSGTFDWLTLKTEAESLSHVNFPRMLLHKWVKLLQKNTWRQFS